MATIVVAEDEDILAHLLKLNLKDAGYTALVATNGVAALDLIQASKPALVVTDFMMPQMTGLQLALVLRETPGFQDLPIILITGSQGNVGRAYPGLFNAIIAKPFTNETLLATIAELLA